MAKWSRSYRRRYYPNPNSATAAKRKHVREAQEFSVLSGGTDQIVKEFFFNLSPSQLDSVLTEYGNKYGWKPREYAEETYPLWKDGSRRMSGLVAKRLYSLLPRQMDLKTKYQIAEELWKQGGPSSSTSFTYGPNVEVEMFLDAIVQKMSQLVGNQEMPVWFTGRFDWLTDGDVKVKTEILNYLQQSQVQLTVNELKERIPLLKRVGESALGQSGGIAISEKNTFAIGNHEFEINFDHSLEEGFVEGSYTPDRLYEQSSGLNWFYAIFWIGVGLFFLYILTR